MKIKNILSCVCSVVLTLNQVSFPTLYVHTEDKAVITLNDDIISKIKVIDKIYDRNTIAELDFSGISPWIKDGDDVILTAKAEFEDYNSGINKAVTVTDFELSGKDAGSYKLDLSQKSFQVSGSIFPKEVLLTPEEFDFSQLTEPSISIQYTYSEDDILKDDESYIMPEMFIDRTENNQYVYRVDYDNPQVSSNYDFIIDKNAKSVPENAKILISLEHGFEKLLTYSKTYDRTYDIDKIDTSFLNLIGAGNDADVFLDVEASFIDDYNAGENKAFSLCNFSLVGNDAECYLLDLPESEFIAYGNILPKEIHIVPEAFVNGEVSGKVEYSYNSEEVLDGDTVNISGEIGAEKDEQTGRYYYVVREKLQTDNPNYIAIFDEKSEPLLKNPEYAVVQQSAILSSAGRIINSDGRFIVNDNVSITVTAKTKEKIKDGIEFVISDGIDTWNTISSDVEDIEYDSDGYLYMYKAVFDIPADNDVEKDRKFICYVNNGVQSPVQDLLFSTEQNNESVSTITFDKKKPVITELIVEANNIGKNIYFTGYATDNGAGIEKIEYGFFYDSTFYELTGIEEIVKENGDIGSRFAKVLPYEYLKSQNAYVFNGKCHFFIKVTDKAGNELLNLVNDDDYKEGNVIDNNTPPDITYIKLLPELSETEKKFITRWTDVINIFPSVNYVNHNCFLIIKAVDKSDDGKTLGSVKSVQLIDRKNDGQEVLISDLQYSQDSDNYSAEIRCDCKIENLYINLTDNYDNSGYVSLRDALKKKYDNPDKEIIDDSTVTTTQTTEDVTTSETTTTTTELFSKDDLSDIISDKWIFDATPPEITFYYGEDKNSDTIYYNCDNGSDFNIKISDENEIAYLKIVQNYTDLQGTKESETITEFILENDLKNYYSENHENPEEKIYQCNGYNVIANKDNSEITYKFDTKNFNDGKYSYTVSAVDYSGNSITNEPESPVSTEAVTSTTVTSSDIQTTTTITTTATTTETTTVPTVTLNFPKGTERRIDEQCSFIVDHQCPTGELKLSAPEELPDEVPAKVKTDNDGKIWISETVEYKNENGEVNSGKQSVTFRIYPESKGTPVENINIFINKDNDNAKPDFIFNSTELVENGDYYEFTIDPESKQPEIPLSGEHTYKIDAQIITESGNKGNVEFTLYVDTEKPAVNTLVAEKIEEEKSIVDKILNIFPFGTFSNCSMVFSAAVSDGTYDIGVDHVTITYDSYEKDSPSVITAEMTPDSNDLYTYKLDLNDIDIFQSNITITVYDKMGKKTVFSSKIQDNHNSPEKVSDNCFVMKENIPPSISVDLPAGDGIERDDGQIWYRTGEEKDISLSVSDDNSGIHEVNVSVNGITFFTDKDNNDVLSDADKIENRLDYKFNVDTFIQNSPMNDDGSYEMNISSVDNSGNVSAESKVFFYDNINPEITQFIFNPATSDAIGSTSDFIEELEYGFYFKQEFEAHVQVIDSMPSSGMDRVEFRFESYEDGRHTDTFTDYAPVIDGEAVYNVPAGFKGQVYAIAYDNVGNVSAERLPQGFVIDNTAPEIEISVTGSDSEREDSAGSEIYTGKVCMEVTVTDTVSGIKSVSFSQNSELGIYNETGDTYIPNVLDMDSELEGGWEIVASDENLVTQIKKVFYFEADDNNISMSFYASDRSENDVSVNSYDEEYMKKNFTVDTIAPVFSVARRNEPGEYSVYADKAEFEITIVERNFNEQLMTAVIRNTFRPDIVPQGNVSPRDENDEYNINFKPAETENTYTAIISFAEEGDYEFSFFGEDMGGNMASDSETGYSVFSVMFHVDTESPVIITNFNKFGTEGDTEIYFNNLENSAQKIPEMQIIVSEHNFYPEDLNISLQYKVPGTAHDDENEWGEYYYTSDWKTDGDTHTLKINFNTDGVYRLVIKAPHDHAGHSAALRDINIILDKTSVSGNPVYTTAVFEYDTKPPELFERNVLGKIISSDEDDFFTNYTAVYGSSDKEKPSPSVSFYDINFARIEINKTSIYTTSYNNKFNEAEIVNEKVRESDIKLPKIIENDVLDMTDYFTEDGVYILEYTAYDKAGNPYSIKTADDKWEKVVVKDTYFHMFHRNVFAYMPEDDYYFFTDKESGRTLSKKLGDFSQKDYQNFEINVIRQTEDSNVGVLFMQENNDSNRQHIPENENQVFSDGVQLSDTAELCTISLNSSYFSRIVPEGQDKRLKLCVSTGKAGERYIPLELTDIHIDNEKPSAKFPEEFKNNKNFFFMKEKTIVLTDVSDDLDESLIYILDYTKGRSAEAEKIIPVYDRDMKTLTFTLKKGRHDIDILLVDEAGNESYLDNVNHLRVGNFWLYVIFATVIMFLLLYKIYQKIKK